jgi:hypothetical protein
MSITRSMCTIWTFYRGLWDTQNIKEGGLDCEAHTPSPPRETVLGHLTTQVCGLTGDTWVLVLGPAYCLLLCGRNESVVHINLDENRGQMWPLNAPLLSLADRVFPISEHSQNIPWPSLTSPIMLRGNGHCHLNLPGITVTVSVWEQYKCNHTSPLSRVAHNYRWRNVIFTWQWLYF